MTQILERLQTIPGVLAVSAFDQSGRCLASSGPDVACSNLSRAASSLFARGAREADLRDGNRVVLGEADGIRVVALGTPLLGKDGATGLSFHLRVAARVYNMEATRRRRDSDRVPPMEVNR
jgi:hypothetical protein